MATNITPTFEGRLENAVNQMIRGVHKGKLKVDKEFREKFREKHRERITKIMRLLPMTSSALPAALMKSWIKYNDEERVFKLCNAVSDAVFEGETDPAHKIWQLLKSKKKYENRITYLKIVNAVKMYMERKEMKYLSMAERDIFEWDENYENPKE